MTDEIELICMPVKDSTNPTPGSTIIKCSKCEEFCWLAPSGREILESNKSHVVCLSCTKINGVLGLPTESQLMECEEAGIDKEKAAALVWAIGKIKEWTDKEI